jgi:hypothetical protein
LNCWMDPDWGRTIGNRRQWAFGAAWRYSGREVLYIEPKRPSFSGLASSCPRLDIQIGECGRL